VLVELKPSGEVVEVKAADLAERGTARAAAAAGAAAPSAGQQRQPDSSGGGRSRQGREDRDRDPGREGGRERDRDRGREQRDREGGRGEYGARGSRGAAEGRDGGQDRERHRDSDKERGSDRARDRGHDRVREQERSRDDPSDRDGRSGGSSKQRQQQPQALSLHKLWVASLIRVRIVDKRMGGGKLYLKKGTVMDVRPDGSCDVRLEEEGRGVVTVHQDQLETVVPKEPGAGVMVVAGEHRGRRGRLLQANKSSGAAALQLLGDMQVVRLMLDDVAQFMGHLDDEDE
jgi:G patch domain/KOW motif-containing protein